MAYINFNTATKNDRASRLNIDIGANAIINIYTGTQPASPDSAATGTLLVTLTGASNGFGVASSGVLTANAITAGTAVATGTAGWARVANATQSPAANGIVDLDVATSGASVTLASVAISANSTVSLSTFVISEA